MSASPHDSPSHQQAAHWGLRPTTTQPAPVPPSVRGPLPRAVLLVSSPLGLAVLAAFLTATLSTACSEAEGLSDTADTAALVCTHDPPLSYDTFGRQYLRTHCAGCHSSGLPEGYREGAPVGVDLDTWAGALQWAERTEARATGDSPTMPPGGGPTDEERARFTEWVQCELLPAAAEAP